MPIFKDQDKEALVEHFMQSEETSFKEFLQLYYPKIANQGFSTYDERIMGQFNRQKKQMLTKYDREEMRDRVKDGVADVMIRATAALVKEVKNLTPMVKKGDTYVSS